jgi:hypothetical protein
VIARALPELGGTLVVVLERSGGDECQVRAGLGHLRRIAIDCPSAWPTAVVQPGSR